jgi:hypothetical protein
MENKYLLDEQISDLHARTGLPHENIRLVLMALGDSVPTIIKRHGFFIFPRLWEVERCEDGSVCSTCGRVYKKLKKSHSLKFNMVKGIKSKLKLF